MNILAREQLLSAFPPEDRERLSLPALETVNWPSLDFMSWFDRSGDTAFVVFDNDGEAKGLILERMAIHTTNARSFMCSLCRTVHERTGIANFTYKCRCGTGYHTLTDMFCADLQCSLYVRGLLPTDGSQFHETITVERKIARLLEGIDRFQASIASFESRHRERPKLRVVGGSQA